MNRYHYLFLGSLVLFLLLFAYIPLHELTHGAIAEKFNCTNVSYHYFFQDDFSTGVVDSGSWDWFPFADRFGAVAYTKYSCSELAHKHSYPYHVFNEQLGVVVYALLLVSFIWFVNSL